MNYAWCGRPLPSVTQILAATGVAPNFDRIAPDVLAHARERGIMVHRACHYLDEDDLDESTVAPEIAGYVAAYRLFLRETGCKPIAVEEPVYHVELGYAGTPDLRAWLAGRRTVIDRKTTTALHASTALQTMAYQLAANAQWPREPSTSRAALRLLADGTYRLTAYTRDASDRNVWLAALLVYNGSADKMAGKVIAEWKKTSLR